jgi:hypothetical protein
MIKYTFIAIFSFVFSFFTIVNISLLYGSNETLVNVSGATIIKDIEKTPIVYPNPFRNVIYIDNINNHFNEAVVTDVLGKVIVKMDLSDRIMKIDHRVLDFSAIPDGIYFVSLHGAGNERHTVRLVKSVK